MAGKVERWRIGVASSEPEIHVPGNSRSTFQTFHFYKGENKACFLFKPTYLDHSYENTKEWNYLIAFPESKTEAERQ